MRRLSAVLLAATLTGSMSGLLSGCSPDAKVATTPAPSEAATPAAGASAESAFLAATAAHLCEVQSDLFEDPAELAAAYASTPEYAGLSEDLVDDLTARLTADPAFSEELRREIAHTCG